MHDMVSEKVHIHNKRTKSKIIGDLVVTLTMKLKISRIYQISSNLVKIQFRCFV